jgi:hypothetical protein
MNYLEIMRAEHEKAKIDRKRVGYSGESKFIPRVCLIDSEDKCIEKELRISSNSHKYALVRAVCLFGREARCRLIILTFDTRKLDMKSFCQEFKIPYVPSSEDSSMKDAYLRILKSQFDGRISNMPRHLWTESINTMANGPYFPLKVLDSTYREDEGDRVVYLNTIGPGPGLSDLLIDWWQT